MHVLVRVDALPGRVAGDTRHTSAADLSQAFQRAAKGACGARKVDRAD